MLKKSIKCRKINFYSQNSKFFLIQNKFNKTKVVNNGVSIFQAKGVEDYLNRQKKVKKIQ